MKGVPTTYNGVRFRSRGEAKWAAFFDGMRWPWEYEPIDLDGYIPDFLLKFERPLLVEVKADLRFAELEQHAPKIVESGWDGDFVIVGAAPFHGRETSWSGLSIGYMRQATHGQPDGHAFVARCERCEQSSVFCWSGSFRCRRCGVHDGDHHLDLMTATPAALVAWKTAANATQWQPSGPATP